MELANEWAGERHTTEPVRARYSPKKQKTAIPMTAVLRGNRPAARKYGDMGKENVH